MTLKLGDVFTFTDSRPTILGPYYADARPGEHFLVTGPDRSRDDLFTVHNLTRKYTNVWRGAFIKDHIRVIGAYPIGTPVHECVCECDACASCHEYGTAFLPVSA